LCTSINATPPTDIYTLSLHDALPIYRNELQIIWDSLCESFVPHNKSSNDKISESEILRFLYGIKKLKNLCPYQYVSGFADFYNLDRKSTRLNSSHVKISYAVFCLKKK